MRNPFVVDRPLTDQDPFYGREALIERLRVELAEGQRLWLLLGKHHIGKTSFINQLGLRLGSSVVVHRLAWDEPPPADGAVRGRRAGRSAEPHPLARLAQAMALELGQPWPEGEAPSGTATAAGAAAAIALRERLGPPLGVGRAENEPLHLICIDALTADELAPATGWDEALRLLAAELRNLPGLAVLIAVEGRPEECLLPLERLPVSPLVLGSLTLDETEELLMLLTHGMIHFDYESLRRVHLLAGGEPLFVQHFGRILFARRQSLGWVALPDVEAATDEIVRDAGPEFDSIWQSVSPLERIALCIFAERIGNQGLGSAHDVAVHLARLRVHLSDDLLQQVLERLAQREILEELGGKSYRVRNGLLFRWLREQQSTLEAVRAAPGVHQSRPRAVSPWPGRRVDWVALGLWLLAALLVAAITYVWRSRELRVTWTATPPAEQQVAGQTPAASLPTPEKGVIPGSLIYIAKAQPTDKWAIYRMRPDGSDPQPITLGNANDTAPVASPDSRRIAFVSDRDGNREVYVMNADGNQTLNLTNHPAEDWTPAWSPDGAKLAFASFRDGNWELYTMDATGANVKRITRHNAADYSPAWSPDGARVAFVSDRDGNLEIYVLELATGAVTRITQDKATDQAPAWSPDGRELLWESYRDGNMEIYAGAPDGANLRNLSQDSYADDHGGTWSPWSHYIAWYTNRDKGWDIYRLDLETGERVNITVSPMLEQWPSWGR